MPPTAQTASVVQLIRGTIDSQESRVAVTSRGGDLTYSDLGRVAAKVKTVLDLKGAPRQRPVAVCAAPSPMGIATILGVVLAGYAYVPVCPSLPQARAELILQEAGVRYMFLCDMHPRPLSVPDVEQLEVSLDFVDFDNSSLRPVAPCIDAESPFAVIFTSGSSGIPKGVVVPHRALDNRILWGQREYPLSMSDRVLQHTRYIYDFSAWEIFAPLAFGGTLVSGPFHNYPDFVELAEIVAEKRATVAHFVPSVLAAFVHREAEFRRCDSLRLVFSGGEQLTANLANRLANTSSATLFNQYGPTETCVDSTFYCYPGPYSGNCNDEPEPNVSIGVPITGTRTYLLSESLDEVEGDTGELYIAGTGVAHGYAGRPSLTAERFLPEPGGDPGSRMYRTGDVVRRRPDGSMVFVGRTDMQVNVRGTRVELGEVETALADFPGVLGAVAVLTAGAAPRLIAVVEVAGDAIVEADKIRDSLRDHLPSGAVPDRVYVESRLPRLPSGKLDRQAAERVAADLESARSPQVPRHASVRPGEGLPSLVPKVIGIWRRYFDADEIDPDDDFFELGGHSLLAVEVVSVVNEELDAGIELADFFESPTAKAMANLIGGDSHA